MPPDFRAAFCLRQNKTPFFDKLFEKRVFLLILPEHLFENIRCDRTRKIVSLQAAIFKLTQEFHLREQLNALHNDTEIHGMCQFDQRFQDQSLFSPSPSRNFRSILMISSGISFSIFSEE